MAQHDDRHLTTEQLSALLDQQLSSQEQAEYNAHLNSCRQCQKAMSDLKATVALLHSLPQPTLPRSFLLPATTAHTQEQTRRNVHPLTTTTRRRPPNRLGYLARSSIRTLSTIAAVIGVIFILSSFLTSHSFGGSATSSGSSAMPVNGQQTLGPKRGSAITTPHASCNQSTPRSIPCGTQHTPASAPHQTPVVKVLVTPTPPAGQPGQNQTNSPAIDLNSPQAHLGLGAVLLLIGVLGVALTRKRRE